MKLLIPIAVSLTLVTAGCGPGSENAADGKADRGAQQEARKPAPTATLTVASPDRAGATAVAGAEARRPDDSSADSLLEADAGARAWKDADGNIVASGEFIDLMDDKVCIQDPGGLGRVIPLAQLCSADQQYVRAQAGGPAVVEQEDQKRRALEAASQNDTPVPAARSETPGVVPVSSGSTSRRKVVIPFDFESKFDDGDYGSRVGDMVWKKLEREGGFIIPESMLDVRDLLAANNLKIGPDTPLQEVKSVVRDYFDADIGIWGSVERAAGFEWDVYDLVIRCVDFSHEPQPKVIYQKTGVRTQVVSEIPHLYVKEMLDELYQREQIGPPPVDLLAEENWKNNPNLVTGGDFEQGARGAPSGWESRGGQQREPLGGLVSWVPEAGSSGNRVIRFQFSKAVGDSTGVMYYSDWFPIDEGARYRFQCRYRTNGPSPKVFIKCYAAMPSQYQQQAGYRPSPGEYIPEDLQRREVYRSQQNLKGPKNTWNTQIEDFTPKHTKYGPRWGKVMLYAYLGGGAVDWDDVVLKQIVPASPSETKKDPRHSMESTVTIQDMQENERRGREAREGLREGKN